MFVELDFSERAQQTAGTDDDLASIDIGLFAVLLGLDVICRRSVFPPGGRVPCEMQALAAQLKFAVDTVPLSWCPGAVSVLRRQAPSHVAAVAAAAVYEHFVELALFLLFHN